MKKLIFIFLSVLSFAITVAQATTASGCINNAGHISLTVDSTHHVIKSKWVVDTSDYEVDAMLVSAEYLYKPAEADTLYYTCIRCDSSYIKLSSEERIFIRELNRQSRPPANEASYKVYTAKLIQSSTKAPTATVLENTIGTIT